ncbi:ABC transporter permease [Chloroflexus aggregans]|uniref:Binding-protein-dependent transport systems inner membrane component n=1 Tax=Chloroflexus aggregans (strain MD-66 / DSM 9485) TaxID=326427 RepID=B8G3B7_CHLAD|nr:iron ABC transporter permease [Chloroflexus aggregans]ACL25290.1 binding-protein-dependent transport systems inner membrane component [Chloroflexus aggregans DSM 9485]
MIRRTTLTPAALSTASLRRQPWLLIGLSLAVVMLVLLPISYLIVRALEAGPDAWAVLLRPRTLRVVFNSLGVAIATALLSVVIAAPLAWLTVCVDIPGRRFWAIATALPLAVPSYINGFAIIVVLGPVGLLQQMLAPFGVERLPPIYGFAGAVLALTLSSYPYVLLNMRAALLRCDPAVEDAARSMGDSPWRVFWRILLPQVRPAIAIGALLAALYSLSDFGAVSLLQFETFTRSIYVQYRGSFDRSGAALLALVLIGLTLSLIGIEHLIRGRPSMSRTTCAVARLRRLADIGWWRWPAALYAGLITLLGVGMPLIALSYWLIRGLLNGQTLTTLWRPLGNSLLAAGGAALLTVVMAVPIALLVARFPSQLSRLLDAAAYTGYALPGIVVALALVFFGANFMPWIYQTLPMLLSGLAIRFLPQAVGGLRTTLQQMNPRVEDAARSLGRTPLAVFIGITLPLIMPGVLSAAALVFLTSIKELPTTLLLSPTGFPTLATMIWSATSEAMFTQAAAPALVLLMVSAGAMALMLINERTE